MRELRSRRDKSTSRQREPSAYSDHMQRHVSESEHFSESEHSSEPILWAAAGGAAAAGGWGSEAPSTGRKPGICDFTFQFSRFSENTEARAAARYDFRHRARGSARNKDTHAHVSGIQVVSTE